MKANISGSGLKCDNPNCDYVDPNIPFEEYGNYVNYPCPKCGQPLLTPQAYEMCLKLKSMGDFLTELTGDANENDTELRVSLDMDKDGNIGIKK